MTTGVRATIAALFAGTILGGCEGCVSQAPASPEAIAALPEPAAGEAPRCLQREDLQSVAGMADPELRREVLVLLDQTTEFPQDVRQSILDQVTALADPGTRLSVGTFSSYAQRTHSQIVFETVIEPAFPDAKRGDAPMRALRELNECLGRRSAEEAERLGDALRRAFADGSPAIARSDVLANVKEFSSRLGDSGAADRILVVASDMLENSSAISFYGNRRMRTVDPQAELAKVEQAGLLGEMPQTRVFVIGAGLLPAEQDSYRTLEEVDALKRFWEAYFKRSGATAVAIGTPRLHRRIG